MTEYTAHIQVPDAAIGAVLHDLMLGLEDVSCATLRSGQGSWLSVGYHAENDDNASVLVGSLMYSVSQMENVTVPSGYREDCLDMFENSPVIVTSGRTVIYSSGV